MNNIFPMKISFDLSREAFCELFEMDMRAGMGTRLEEGGQKVKLYSGRETGLSNNFIVSFFLKHKKEIDSLIEKAIYPGGLDDLTPTQRSILRLCVSEIMLGVDIPHVIDKWLRITSEFASLRLAKFIHGVLSDIISELK